MKITFAPKNRPLYPELRISLRMAQILLVLSIASRGRKSSLIRLHLFNWAINNSENRLTLLKFSNNRTTNLGMWSIDPMLNRALEFAVSENLIGRSGSVYSLTEKGSRFSKEIADQVEFTEDRDFLEAIGKNITEDSVVSFLSGGN